MRAADFHYEAIDEAGNTVTGEIQAATTDEAVAQLRAKGFFPTSVRSSKPAAISLLFDEEDMWVLFDNVRFKIDLMRRESHMSYFPISHHLIESARRRDAMDRAILFHDVGSLAKAGYPILDALYKAGHTSKYKYQSLMLSVHDSVRQGDSVLEPIRRSGLFDSSIVKLIGEAEEAGELDLVCLKLAESYAHEYDQYYRASSFSIYRWIAIDIFVFFILLSLAVAMNRYYRIIRSGRNNQTIKSCDARIKGSKVSETVS